MRIMIKYRLVLVLDQIQDGIGSSTCDEVIGQPGS